MNKIKEFVNTHNRIVEIIVMITLSWAGTCGICYLASLICGYKLSFSVFSFAIFVCTYLCLKHTKANISALGTAKEKRKRFIYSFLLAWFFSVSMIMGYQLKAFGMTQGGIRGKGMILIRGIGLAFAALPFTNYFFYLVEKIKGEPKERKSGKMWKSKNVFLISWLVIFLLWIPVFLAYYPAIMAYDFHRQSQEAARGFIWFNSYQPLAHTFIIWVSFQFGKLFDSYEIGMAFYSILQMLAFSVSCGYSCNIVYRLTKKKWPVVLMVLFFGLYPIISVHSVAATKDIFFSALFLTFMCLFIERHYFSNPKKQIVIDIVWLVEGIVMMLFRNNAVYAVAVFAVVYLIVAEKKQKLRIFIICILLAAGGKGALEGVQLALGTTIRGSKLEMYNIPVQQMARVGHNQGEILDNETYELLNTYMPEDLWHRYNPPLGDSVRWVLTPTYEDVWKDNMGEVLKAWFVIGLKYPDDYIDAFLLVNAGYWSFDDVTWAEVFGYGLETRMGAVSTFTSSTSDAIPEGIAHESKFPWLERKLEAVVSANCFYQWPIVSVLFQMATYCWALLLILLGCIYLKDRKKTIIVLLPMVYMATMFLGPVVQSRYVLPIIVVVPVLLALMTYRAKNAETKEAIPEKAEL